MKYFRYCTVFCIVLVIFAVLPNISSGRQFVAYSLKEAKARLKVEGHATAELKELGGITRLAGLVYDENGKDIIIVGERGEDAKRITLDDFVVALKAILAHNEYPYVSIDRTEDTDKTDKLKVNFKGGIENTQFGQDMLAADIAMKKLSLGLLPSEPWGVKSYFEMSLDKLRKSPKEVEDRICSRFWYYPKSISLVIRDGTGIIREALLGVETRVDQVIINGKPVSTLKEVRDEIGDLFTSSVMSNLKELKVAYPEIERLWTLLNLTALAKGIQELKQKKNVEYWLQEYKGTRTDTPKYYDMIRKKEQVMGSDNRLRELLISGGIELNPFVLRIKAGEIKAFRDAVLESKPNGNALIWSVPLDGWRLPSSTEDIDADEKPESKNPKQNGFTLERQIYRAGSQDFPPILPKSTSSQSMTMLPKVRIYSELVPQKFSYNVGGVMLHGVAKISGSSEAKIDLTSGNFSLIVDGQNARLSPEVYRKFITALWSVYYSQEDPGISIDPISCFHFDPNDPERDEKLKKCLERFEKKEEKHLVRYIGKVINTDLGRVMREADYLMKKWSVGTEKPGISGFKNPDEYRGRKTAYVGGSSRFWFVPEDMKFKQGGDMLLFEDGRMTVKTEFMFRNERGIQADPYNEKFAHFFTENYRQIATKYTVYQELFDYAKMVSLAKYLKEQGIPLFWFLMSNKDLVITEDSPGTVDALAKGSDYYKNLYIMGGVNLGFKGNYVYDQRAVRAIDEAVSELPTNVSSTTSLSSGKSMTRPYSEPFSFDLGKQSYTVVPQHSLTSGKDRRGIRYQTDLAFKSNGGPGLELVRYFNPRRQDSGEFGKGWHILIPYRIKPAGNSKKEFLNAMIPEKMAVENLLTGEQEVLSFSTDRYSIAGYVPEKLKSSQVVGLFLMSDASFRLADKLGNEFWFNQAGYLTDMRFSRDHHFHFEYFNGMTKAFEKDIYQVMPADKEQMEFLNALIPKRMRVVDLINGDTEDLIFSDKGRIAGYMPEDSEKSRFKILALMSNLSFRLLDKDGNEVVFSPSGSFDGMIVSLERPIVKSVSQGDHRIDFKLTIDKSGKIMIASAHLSGGGEKAKPTYVVKYQYDEEGRLYSVKGSSNEVAELHDQPINKVAVFRQTGGSNNK